MKKETTTTYTRRNRRGCKETDVRGDGWSANVMDFAPNDDRDWGFTNVSIHAAMAHGEPAEITVKDFSKEFTPFYTIGIGGPCAVDLYLSPEQARTLAVELAQATGLMD